MAESKSAQQVREITDKLEQGIKELFESERFKEYLRTMSKFYNYSFNNTLLIAMQKPEATYVAGYASWQRNFDRQVMKGEKGIKILAPAPYKAQVTRKKNRSSDAGAGDRRGWECCHGNGRSPAQCLQGGECF